MSVSGLVPADRGLFTAHRERFTQDFLSETTLGQGADMEYQQRRQIIEGLLDHWQDFVLPSPGFGKADGEGVGFAFTSGMSGYPSVVELVRCVEVCGRMAPSHYRHLAGFYSSEWRTTDARVKRRDAKGRMVDDVARVRARVVPSWVVWRMVDRAVDFLLGVWSSSVPLELPPALTRKLMEFTDQDGTHLTEAA